MADLTIPKDHQPVLNKIRMLPEESFQGLLRAINDEAPLKVKGLSTEEAEEIQQVVKELYRVREFLDMEVPEFAADIAEALQEVESYSGADLPAFRDRLLRLLTIESLTVASKAASLKAEYERRFCSARILTDARPIYGVDPSKLPAAGMITHTLRISYHDNTPELREFYVAMDSDDVATLRAMLDRADIKAKSLNSVFDAAKVRIITP